MTIEDNVLGQDVKCDHPSLFLQDGDRLLVCRPLQALSIDRQDLIASLQTPIHGRGALKHKPTLTCKYLCVSHSSCYKT